MTTIASTKVRVRYKDTDCMKIVYYPVTGRMIAVPPWLQAVLPAAEETPGRRVL